MRCSWASFIRTTGPTWTSEWTAALRGEPYDIDHRIVVGEM